MQANREEGGRGKKAPTRAGSGNGDDEGGNNRGWTKVVRGRQHTQKSEAAGAAEQKASRGEIRKDEGLKGTRLPSHGQTQRSNGTETEKAYHSRPGAPDRGNGSMVFAQLRAYMRNKAPKDFVMHTVLKLIDQAKERRFKSHLLETKQDAATNAEKMKLRALWVDEISKGAQEKYGGLLSTWDCGKEDHMERLKKLVGTWLTDEAIDQNELEARLRQFTFTNDPRAETTTSEEQPTLRSFKEAVAGEEETNRKINEADGDHQHWYDLCMKPAEPTSVLRGMTDEEKQAIEMILQHKLEVPIPPRFLIQIMNARELAIFTDLFMAIEYPLYAHLLTGQRFGPNMTKQAILQHIHMGAEAALPQKLQIQEFKSDLSRVEVNADTRVVTVTFKGKQTAMKWVGWGMPLGMRMLKLEDYETQREEAKINNKLIRIDFYRFTIAVKRGALTSSDLYWVLTHKLGLKTQALQHAETGTGSINDKQWEVTIKASACSAGLRQLSALEVDVAALTIFHHEVYSHWPCSTCGTPDHSGRYCRTPPEGVQAKRKTHGKQIEGKLPSNRGQGGRGYTSKESPVSVEQLLIQLRGSNASRKPGTTQQRMSSTDDAAGREERPTLPREWEQSMRKQNHPRTDESEHARAQNEERKQRGQQAEEPSEGGTREKNERTQKQHAEEDYNSYGEGDYQMSDSDGYRTPTAHAVEEQVHDTVPARPKNAETVSDNIGADKEAIPDKEDIPVKRHEPGGNNEGLEARQKSLSPKRQLSDNWKTNGDSERGKTSKAQKTCSIGNEGRQEQTTGSEPDEGGPSRPKQPIQQYMHSFVTFSTHDTRDAGRKKTQQGEQADTKRLEEDGFLMTGIKGGDDMGRPLQHWLDIVGGKITDVAANGHCGRLAFLAALHNVTTGLSPLHTDVVEAANNIKKQVMNNMIANVADEFKVHPAEMESALAAAGKTIINKDSAEETFCALANHYADQRNKSVKSSVPMNYWVRPDHIKAMAMHAREMVFVLDVVHEDNVRLQVYGYQDWGLTDNTATETGVVSTMPSHIGTDILRELTAAGTLPLIMVLHYSKAGNHYQAVTYEPKRYEVYTDKWKELTSQRNRVLTKYEGRALDAEPYDSDKLAKAATKELKALRRAAKVGKPRCKESEPPQTGLENIEARENSVDRRDADSDSDASKAQATQQEEGGPGAQVQESAPTTPDQDNRQGSIAAEHKAPTAHYPPSVGVTMGRKQESAQDSTHKQKTSIPHRDPSPTLHSSNDRATI